MIDSLCGWTIAITAGVAWVVTDATMDKLLPYVERELGLLRQAGAEFAGRYPKLAGSLGTGGEGGALDQAVDMRIGAAPGSRPQAAGQLGIAAGKLGAGLPQQAQFTFDIRQQFFHRGIRD